MKARLVIELPLEELEAAQSEGLLHVSLESVEVAQQGGLLSEQHEVLYAEGFSPSNAHAMGLPAGGPFLRIWLRPGGTS